MKTSHFDRYQKWVPLRKKLVKKNLTLGQLRSIEDEVLLQMKEGDEDLGNEILSCIDEKRGFLRGFEGGVDEFILEEPLAQEFNSHSVESTFLSRMGSLSKMIRKQQSVLPQENLNLIQQKEVALLAGENLSPEVLAHAIDVYAAKLRGQIKIAESFYFGRVREGLRGLSKLSLSIQDRIESLAMQGGLVPAILHSVEEQMGMHAS